MNFELSIESFGYDPPIQERGPATGSLWRLQLLPGLKGFSTGSTFRYLCVTEMFM